MAYITARELRAVVPDQYRDAALSDSGATPDPGLLQAVIDAACQEVDALIEGRVRLPLSEPYPKKVKTAARYIALSILFVRRGIEMPSDMADTVNGWRKRLGEVGAGDLRIEAPADEDTSAAALSTKGSIVVRPVVTGTGGLIGALLFLLSFLARPAAGIDARTYDFVVPTNPLIESADFMEWSQAESVRMRYRLPAADATREARWEISDATNLWLNLAPTRSGTLWTWNPAPTQTCLNPGNYQGRVAVYDRTGTNLTFHRILAMQDIRVHEARDPATLIFASPLATICTGRPIYAEADAAAMVALGSHVGSTNPHSITPAMIGAATGQPIYAEADAAGLAAVVQVQSNLDLVAATSIVAVSVGGYFYPDYFTLDPINYGYTATDLGTTSEYNSVMIQWRTYESSRGYLLEPNVVRQADWDDAVAYSELENLELVETNGQTIAEWSDGVASGAVGRITATLGGYSRSLEMTANLGAPWSNEWWVADKPGSLRESINTAAVARASAAGAGQYVYLPGAYTSTNFLRDTNFFAAGVDLTCASAWNSYRYTNSAGAVHNALGNYHAGTAITPQHIAYAAHWICPTGTVFRFVDTTNGLHDRTLVDQRILPNDIAVGLLDSPLGSEITPAKILPADGMSYLRGRYGLRGSPGLRVVALDQIERAWPMRSGIMETLSTAWPETAYLTGDPDLPFYRTTAIGGDSGNPIFLIVRDFAGTWNAVLFATYCSPGGGPFISGNRAAIEAEMIAMGGSNYTNLTAVDLSGWTNYDSGSSLPDF